MRLKSVIVGMGSGLAGVGVAAGFTNFMMSTGTSTTLVPMLTGALTTAGGISGLISIAAAPFVLSVGLGMVCAAVGVAGCEYILNKRTPPDEILWNEVEKETIMLNEAGEKEFKLEDYSHDLFKKVCRYFSDKFSLEEDDSQKPKISKIKIKPNNLSDFANLLYSGLGAFDTKHLIIEVPIDREDGNSFMLTLCNALDNVKFKKLKTLTLKSKNNKLRANALPSLSKIGQKLPWLEELDLSDNWLNSNDGALTQGGFVPEKFFGDFFKDFHINFPHVKKLMLQKINLNEETISSLIDLVAFPSLLEEIDISQNRVSMTALEQVLAKPEFQYNLNLISIKTGLNNEEKIQMQLDRRNTRIRELKQVLEGIENKPILIVLLEKMMQGTSVHLPQELEVIFSQPSSIGERDETIGDKWKLLARELKSFSDTNGGQRDLIDLFVKFKRKYKTFTIGETISRLANHDYQEIDLVFSEKGAPGSLQAKDVVNNLRNALHTLSDRENKPIINKVDLSHLGLTDTDFSNLLVSGLGDYQTTELHLRNNHLTDESICALLKQKKSFQKLKMLDLSKNKITSLCLNDLSRYAGQVNLEELNISENDFQLTTPIQKHNFSYFCNNLHKTAPSLKKINLTNIGLTEANIVLIKPLLRNMSLLAELIIDQKTINKDQSYEDLFRDKGFQANFALQKLDAKKKEVSHVKKQIEKKKRDKCFFQSNANPENIGDLKRPVLIFLLENFLDETFVTFSNERVNHLLDYCDFSENVSFKLSNRKKLWLEARQLEFYRDKATLVDKECSPAKVLTKEEVITLRQNKLSDFWRERVKNNQKQDDEIIARSRKKYSFSNVNKVNLHAYCLGGIKFNICDVSVYYVEDDTIRFVNRLLNKQIIMSRPANAFWKKINQKSFFIMKQIISL